MGRCWWWVRNIALAAGACAAGRYLRPQRVVVGVARFCAGGWRLVNNDQFGSGVAISEDGLVLAVGARGRSTARGGVYIYDKSGSSWVQRGSVLLAADGVTLDRFGRSVSLSSDGAILAVGAPQWEGSETDEGAVYVYAYSGS